MAFSEDLVSLFQKHCSYKINSAVQLLAMDIDVDKIRDEMFGFISRNDYGTQAVSLRLPEGETNWIDDKEKLEHTGLPAYNVGTSKAVQLNEQFNDQYTEWHPELKDGYVAGLVPELEEFSGLNIGRVRLGWLPPGFGYEMHWDAEPMRLHIPLITNDLAYIINGEDMYHMRYGKLYHLLPTQIHTAFNFGKLPRLHLVFSTYLDHDAEQELRDLATQENLEGNFLKHVSKGVDEKTINLLASIHRNNPDVMYQLKRIIQSKKG